MNIDSSRAFISPIVRAYRTLDASVAEALGHAHADSAHLYRLAAGRVMAEIVWHAFMPVFHEHPDLEPFCFSPPTSEPSLQPEPVALSGTAYYVRSCIKEAEALLAGLSDPAERAWFLSGVDQILLAVASLPAAIDALSTTDPSRSA